MLDDGGPGGPSRAVAIDPGELASALKRMSQLHAQGKSTDAECSAAKRRLLGTGAAGEGR